MTAAWALAVERWEDLLAATADGRLVGERGGWRAALRDGRPIRFERLYAGDEFCHHLIPTRKEWSRWLATADDLGVPLTLATPPVTDEGLAAVRSCLDSLMDRPDSEVVVNDWGALRLVARDYPGLRPVLGRTLRRQQKDPRSDTRTATAALGDGFTQLIQRFGVAMISADRLPDAPTALPLALHVPYEFVTTGRICAISGVSFPDTKKFLADFSCPKPCREFYLDLEDPAGGQTLRQKGNTLYASNGGQGLLCGESDWVARWVYDLSVDKTGSMLALPAAVRA